LKIFPQKNREFFPKKEKLKKKFQKKKIRNFIFWKNSKIDFFFKPKKLIAIHRLWSGVDHGLTNYPPPPFLIIYLLNYIINLLNLKYWAFVTLNLNLETNYKTIDIVYN
jgi:hypothetical protein